MRKLSGRMLILWALSVILCVVACAPAFASVGDRVLVRIQDGDNDTRILNLLPYGDGFILSVRKNNNPELMLYPDAKAQPETFVLDEKALQEESEEGESGIYTFVNNWFSWNNEVYALTEKTTFGGNTDSTAFSAMKARLENGQVILEASGLPELDLSGLVQEEDGDWEVLDILNLFISGSSLVLVLGEDEPERLEVIDLRDGFCTEVEPDDFSEAAPGPEGSLLITKAEWSEEGNTATVRICSMDPDGRNEKLLAEISGCSNSIIIPCYDKEKDTLYFVRNGELCGIPQFDPERIEPVNSCLEPGESAVMLPGGFVLMKTRDAVLIKNTDPAQRGSVTLRILNRGWGETISETIYAMSSVRGDISVIQQEEGDIRQDILQAMLTRDDSIDIYVLHYDSNEFLTLFNREYLPDLSGNAKIAENTDRLYPYIRDAVMQEGKIIGVPVWVQGTTIGVSKTAWKTIGGTDAELPKTWSQFFDWLGALPERMEGKDVTLTNADRVYVRGEILHMLLDQYEIRMERRGEKDYAFASPELCEAVRKLNNVDFNALHVADNWSQENEDEPYDDSGVYREPLLYIDVSTRVSGDRWEIPFALSFSEGEEAILPVEMDVAFVNPFSVHQEEAAEFLALAMENLNLEDQYNVYTDRTEPVRRPEYEEDIQWLRDMIESDRENLEKAKGEEKDRISEEIRLLEEGLKEFELEDWRISREEIESYRERQSRYMIRGYDFFNDLFTTEDDEERFHEFEQIFRTMENAKMSPEELLGMLDQKVRMIRMERN